MCLCVSVCAQCVWVGYVHVGVRRKFPLRIVQISVALFLIARKTRTVGFVSSYDLWSLFPSFSPSFIHSFIHSHMHSLWLIRIVLSLCMIPLLCVSSSSSPTLLRFSPLCRLPKTTFRTQIIIISLLYWYSRLVSPCTVCTYASSSLGLKGGKR